MALSRKAKIWLIVLGIPVVLVIGAAIAVKLYFTNERLKAIVIPKIEEATERKVTVGTVSLSIFPTLALEIDSLSVSNKKGFSDKPFIALDKLVLDVRLGALVKGNLEITTMTLERPWMLFEVNEQGETNYSSPKKTETGTKGTEPPATVETQREETKGYGFLLSDLRIVDGSIEYADYKGNSATRISGLNQQLRMEWNQTLHELRVETSGTIDKFSYGSVTTPLVSDMRITSSTTLLYEQEKDLLTIRKGSATVQDIALDVSGTVATTTVAPVMDIVIGSDKVNIAEIFSLAPKGYMKKAEGLKGKGIAQVKITIKGAVTDSTNPDVFGTISATNATLQYEQLPKPITNVNIVSDFTRTQKKVEFHLRRFSATLGNNPLSGTLSMVSVPVKKVTPAKKMASDTDESDYLLTMGVNAVLNLAEVKEYYPVESGTDLRGAMKANVNITGRIADPQAMQASGSMEFQNVTIKSATSENPIQNLQGTITFNNQIVEAKKLSMTLGKSDLSLSFWLKNYLSMVSDDKGAPKPVANLTLNSNHLFTADIMGEPKQQTKGTAQKSATSGVQSAPADKATSSPQQQQSGVPLPNVNMNVAATIGTLTMEKMELKNVRGTMKIADGVITMQNLSCNTFEGSVITKGTLNLQNPERPTFDLALDMNGLDGHAMLPHFTSFGERLFGKLTMNTTLKGTLDDTLGLVPQLLSGTGRVQVENGRLAGVKVNKAVGEMLKLPDLEQIQFKDWTNGFTISDGRVHIKDLKIMAFDADYVVNGSQGLDGSLDFSMALVLPEKTSARINIPGFAGQAVGLFKDESGRVKLDFTVGGTSDNPKVALDTKAAQKKLEDLAKQKLGSETKKAQEDLKKKAEDAIKGLFKKK